MDRKEIIKELSRIESKFCDLKFKIERLIAELSKVTCERCNKCKPELVNGRTVCEECGSKQIPTTTGSGY